MESTYYRFSIGTFHCMSLLDGYVDYPIQNMYRNVAREQAQEVLRQRGLPVEVITTPYTFPYVDTGSHRVLVDMGGGGMIPGSGHLLQSLQAAGIQPADIDTVIISHAHPDHIGGTLDERGQPIYANATYYIWKSEWDFWLSETATLKTPELFVNVARRNLEPLRDRVVLVEQEAEILPGVSIRPAPGHTPGHVVVELRSGADRLVYIADTVLQPLHLEEPTWLPIYDILPDQAEVSKQQVFDRVAAEHLLILGQHFQPFPSLGYIEKREVGWAWKPLTIAEAAAWLPEQQAQASEVIR